MPIMGLYIALAACAVMLIGIAVSLVGAGICSMNWAMAGVYIMAAGGVVDLVTCICLINMKYGGSLFPFFLI